jgi:hypothetical protein
MGHRNCYVLCLNSDQWRLVNVWNRRSDTLAARADVALKTGHSDFSCIHETQVWAQWWLVQTWDTCLYSLGAQSGFFFLQKITAIYFDKEAGCSTADSRGSFLVTPGKYWNYYRDFELCHHHFYTTSKHLE